MTTGEAQVIVFIRWRSVTGTGYATYPLLMRQRHRLRTGELRRGRIGNRWRCGACVIAGDGRWSLARAGGQKRAFLFGTAMDDLGTLPGDAESFPHSINSHGVVVGYSMTGPGRFRAVMWADGQNINLNRFLPGPVKAAGVVLEVAWTINDKRQIAGTALVGGHGMASS